MTVYPSMDLQDTGGARKSRFAITIDDALHHLDRSVKTPERSLPEITVIGDPSCDLGMCDLQQESGRPGHEQY